MYTSQIPNIPKSWWILSCFMCLEVQGAPFAQIHLLKQFVARGKTGVVDEHIFPLEPQTNIRITFCPFACPVQASLSGVSFSFRINVKNLPATPRPAGCLINWQWCKE